MTASAATPPVPEGWPEPFQVDWRTELGSTNEELLAAARAGAAHGLVLVVDNQTAGRGRLGRTWTAPPGSALLCSVLLRPPADAVLHGSVWSVGMAAHAAARDVAGVDVELKWPNDLMVGDRKLAGILAESTSTPGDPSAVAVVVGLGMNVGWPAPPPAVEARAVTLEELAGRPVDRRRLLHQVLARLAPLLHEWTADPGRLHERYRANLATLGRMVRVTLADRELVGEAVDLTADGALVVQSGADRVVVGAGDVVHLRAH